MTKQDAVRIVDTAYPDGSFKMRFGVAIMCSDESHETYISKPVSMLNPRWNDMIYKEAAQRIAANELPKLQ